MLADAGVEGKLDTRGDASKFGGDFGKIVQGVNDTMPNQRLSKRPKAWL